MKQILIRTAFCCCSFLLFANIPFAASSLSATMHAVLDNKAPYRLLLSSIRHTELDNQVIVTLNAINMGSQALVFGADKEIPEKLILEFEEAFNRNAMFPYKEDIRIRLLETDMEILPGKMAKSIELIVEKDKPLAEINVGRDYNSKLFGKKKKKFNSKIRTNKKESTKEAIAKENRTPTETPLIATASIDTTTVVTSSAPPTTTPSPEKTTTNPPKTKRSKKRKVKQEEKESVSFTNNIEEEPAESDFYDDSNCADIVIDSLVVLKNRGKTLLLQYTITNRGNRKANLYGRNGDDSDNLALKAYLASSPNLSRGSFPLGGSFVHKGLEKGLLYPNQSYVGTIKLDLRNKTKFTSYIILNADPFSVMIECDKTNNNSYLFLE